MKKLLAILLSSAVIYSCGSNEGGNTTTNETPSADTATPAPAPDAAGAATVPNQKGLELIASNDCMSCHALDHKVVGPAYIDVSKKYDSTEAVIDSLVHKVKVGGMGNWGNIPMTPHPDLADADAREMVKYILSLKDQ